MVSVSKTSSVTAQTELKTSNPIYMFLFIHLAETVVETTTAILQEAERQKMIKLKIQTDYKIYKLHFVIVVALVLCINRNQP